MADADREHTTATCLSSALPAAVSLRLAVALFESHRLLFRYAKKLTQDSLDRQQRRNDQSVFLLVEHDLRLNRVNVPVQLFYQDLHDGLSI